MLLLPLLHLRLPGVWQAQACSMQRCTTTFVLFVCGCVARQPPAVCFGTGCVTVKSGATGQRWALLFFLVAVVVLCRRKTATAPAKPHWGNHKRETKTCRTNKEVTGHNVLHESFAHEGWGGGEVERGRERERIKKKIMKAQAQQPGSMTRTSSVLYGMPKILPLLASTPP